jgi:D-hydroxyproline dehydrogenase subunit alpha
VAEYDLAVVGAGPAGLAGAVAAAAAGLHVALIDGGRRLGGQYFRHPDPGLGARRIERLHHGWNAFVHLVELCESLQADGLIDHLGDHHVWAVEDEAEGGFHVHATVGHGASRSSATVSSRTLLLATGSYERQIPFPGWDLPGVFTAGGAQALLKGNLVLAGKRVVVAGTGPLLMPVAAGLSASGAEVVGLFEANGFVGYARHPGTLAANTGKLVEGAGYASQLARGRVPVRIRHAVIAAQGTDHLESVTVARLDASGHVVAGSEKQIACDALAVGYGLVPQIELGLELGLAHRILVDGTVALVVDGDQRTSRPNVWAAGESVGVAGAQTALLEGEIAGAAIAGALGANSQDAVVVDGSGLLPSRGSMWLDVRAQFGDDFKAVKRAAARATGSQAVQRAASRSTGAKSSGTPLTVLKRRRDRQRAFADVIRELHPVPSAWPTWLRDDTTVCRCEEVRASTVREAVADLGAADVRTTKLLTRAGMGWCQGRMCGYAVACLAAPAEAGKPSDADLLSAAKRPLSRPVPLGLLAQDPKEEA